MSPRGLRRFSALATNSLPGLVGRSRPDALALLSPTQGIEWKYEELDLKARVLASGLEDLGYSAGSVLISNIPNTAENLLLQLALGHIGAAIATPTKDADAMAKLGAIADVRGVACVDSSSPPLGPAQGALPMITLEEVEPGMRPPAGCVPFAELLAHCPPRGAPPRATGESLLGVYNGAVLRHADALEQGAHAAHYLGLTSADRVMCSVTLMHAFGSTRSRSHRAARLDSVTLRAGARSMATLVGSRLGDDLDAPRERFIGAAGSWRHSWLRRSQAAQHCHPWRDGRQQDHLLLWRFAHPPRDARGAAASTSCAAAPPYRGHQNWFGLYLSRGGNGGAG